VTAYAPVHLRDETSNSLKNNCSWGSMRVAIVGATGLVGRTMLTVLEERAFPVTCVHLLASPRSAGERIVWKNETYTVEPLSEPLPSVDVALFSAGGSVSKEWAPRFAATGAVVIDNSSYWRMDPDVPLVVPEVNPSDALLHKGIIANPNCSTIQLVVALKPLHEAFGLKRVIVSTYQSVSGAGQKGVDQLQAELAGSTPTARISPHPLAYNAVFHTIEAQHGDSEEEIKMQRETRRILHLDNLAIAVTCVRVPVLGGHAESVVIETERPITPALAAHVLSHAPGIILEDDPANHSYPTPQRVADSDAVHVGRLRADSSAKNGLMLWVVANNLRKGAATNAVQIAELLQ